MSTDNRPDPGIGSGGPVARDHRVDGWVRRILFAAVSITVVTTLAIFLILLDNATSYFFGARLSEILRGEPVERTVTFVEFLDVREVWSGEARWAPYHAVDGHNIFPVVWGTVAVTVGAAAISIPIGTATALYLSEYASRASRNRLKPILEVLAGIPTIVYGYFAVSFITPVVAGGLASNVVRPSGALVDRISPYGPWYLGDTLSRYASWASGASVGRYSLLGAAIVVAIMTIPMVSSISEDAMQAVPDELRNGAYALGATKYQVSTRIVLPAAVSGIFASYILAVSRAIGETMAVTLGGGFNAQITADPFDEIMTMTAYMVSMARGTSAVGTVEYQSLFAVGLVLFIMTLTMNIINDYMKRRFQEVYR